MALPSAFNATRGALNALKPRTIALSAIQIPHKWGISITALVFRPAPLRPTKMGWIKYVSTAILNVLSA